ncbi:hypothetical protein [Pedobacter ginsengiterrae]
MSKRSIPNNQEAFNQAQDFQSNGLLQIIRKGIFLIGLSWKQLRIRDFVADFFSVLGSIGFVSVPAFLVGFIFLILPQGRDTLLVLIEQMLSSPHNWWPFFGLVIGVLLWSMASELAIRYAISISDNSGMNLSDERVLWRKTVQKLLAGSFLLWPGILVIIAFFVTMFNAEYLSWPDRLVYFGISILIIIGMLFALSFLYFHKFEPLDKKGPRRTKLGHRSLPPQEQKWINKLYGIYNNHIFSLPKPTNFIGRYRKETQGLVNFYKSSPKGDPNEMPKDKNVLSKNNLIPLEFHLENRDRIQDSVGVLKWVYRLPPFLVYPAFHKQVYKMALSALILLIMISIIPAEWPVYDHIGAAGLVCLAFACYTGLYAGLLFVDKVILPRSPIGIRQLLLIWVVIMSFINQDHPVRIYGKKENRNDIRVHFSDWFAGYKKDVDQRLGYSPEKYPVVFVCAEGGAFRTGAYTALFLTQMEAELIRRNVDLRHSIFAMSGVSGGSVGLGFYNAAAFRSNIPFRDTVTVEKTRKFFMNDSLSPLIGKMFFGEFLNLFYWKMADRFDRAVALEKSWEGAYGKFVDGARNTYGDEFILPDTGRAKPVLLINTTEVETGRQCWVSGASLPTAFLATQRDLLANKVSSTRYSTAINFSSRFPLFSPGAAISLAHGHRLHYLDGGYVENTGTGAMLEILDELRSTDAYKMIRPVVISLRFSEVAKDTTDLKALNELTEIFFGLYNTRVGRSEWSSAMLEKRIKADSGIFIKAPLSPEEKKIPMNWVLSEQSMNRIQADIKIKLHPDSSVFRTFFRKDVSYVPLKLVSH